MLQKLIGESVKYLEIRQRKNGSFLSLSSSNPRDFTGAKKYHTIFPAFLVLSCLSGLKETSNVRTIKRKAAAFLLAQKSEHWSFNYWARETKEAKQMPYPDDLDDTFCALSALFQYKPELIDGSAMAKIVTLLTAVEEKEGGPYRTWLVPPDAKKVWKDVDLVANSNIAYFLSLEDISLPNLTAFVESVIDASSYTSPYYPSEYPVIYFISRFYRGKKTKKIKDFLLSKRHASGKWVNPLNTALAVNSLLNLGTPPDKLDKSIAYLAKTQAPDSWEPYTLCVDPEIDGKRHYAGSSVVTAALCLEAMAQYLQSVKRQSQKRGVGRSAKESSDLSSVYNEVAEKARRRFFILGGDIKRQALGVLKATLKRDKDKQIVLMPYFFKVSLGKNGKSVSDDLLIQLGLANLYGWIAYTIYDDFFDDEGDSKILSVANLCLRELTTIFNEVLPRDSGFPVFFHKAIDTLDSANTWEVSNCRVNPKKLVKLTKLRSLKIPEYGDLTKLAEKSIGHASGPAAILFSLGYKTDSSEIKNLMKFFKHFLIARQLNDDAHDWERDLKMGHINAVGAEIIKTLKQKNKKTVKGKSLNVKGNELFQEIFWYEVVVGVCQDVLKHVQLAREALQKISVIVNTSLFEKLLASIEQSAQEALKEREETIRFLKAY